MGVGVGTTCGMVAAWVGGSAGGWADRGEWVAGAGGSVEGEAGGGGGPPLRWAEGDRPVLAGGVEWSAAASPLAVATCTTFGQFWFLCRVPGRSCGQHVFGGSTLSAKDCNMIHLNPNMKLPPTQRGKISSQQARS